jgi:hypothetical protein
MRCGTNKEGPGAGIHPGAHKEQMVRPPSDRSEVFRTRAAWQVCPNCGPKLQSQSTGKVLAGFLERRAIQRWASHGIVTGLGDHQDLIDKLRSLALECRQLGNVELPDPIGVLDVEPVRDLADEAARVKTRCLNALLEGGVDLSHSFDLMKGTAFEARYSPDGIFRNLKPLPANMLVAADILETAARLLETKYAKEARHQGSPKSGKKRGPDPRAHARIAAIVNAYHPWKNHLPEICAAIDAERPVIEISKKWKNWPDRPTTWVEALEADPKNIIKSLEYSVKRMHKSKGL